MAGGFWETDAAQKRLGIGPYGNKAAGTGGREDRERGRRGNNQAPAPAPAPDLSGAFGAVGIPGVIQGQSPQGALNAFFAQLNQLPQFGKFQPQQAPAPAPASAPASAPGVSVDVPGMGPFVSNGGLAPHAADVARQRGWQFSSGVDPMTGAPQINPFKGAGGGA